MKKVFLGVFILNSLIITAQEKEKENNIEEVEIQGKFLSIPLKNVSENYTIVSKKELENAPSKSIEELLSHFTGLDIRRRGANGVQTDVSLRGSSFEQVLILINGIRMNDAQTGHNTMNIPVDIANVERIEILKGPAARKYGNNAYAGVVNIITKTSAEESVSISASGGDFATYSLGLGSTFGTEKFTHLFQANTSKSEGYRYNTDYEIQNYFYQNQYNIDNGKVTFQAGFSEKKFGANGFYASPLAKDQYEETQASVVSLGYLQRFNNFSLHSNVFWRRGQDMYIYIRNKPSVYRNMHIGNNIGGEINASYKSSFGTTGLGLELRKEFLQSNNLGKRQRSISQMFFEHRFDLLMNKLHVVPGISWGNFSDAGNFFYPGLDVSLELDNFHKVYGNVAKVHRIPSYTDLFYKSATELGNPNLKPEDALSYELGYQFSKNNWLAKASVFARNTNNAIDWVKNNAAEKWNAQNIGNINTKGFEVELSKKMDGFVRDVSIGYTYIDNQFNKTQNFSKYALDNLRNQLVAKMENRFYKFTNQLVYRYTERVSLGSYHLVDEKLNYAHKNLNVYLLINNLTNTDYTETNLVPMPGRWFHLGFDYTFKW